MVVIGEKFPEAEVNTTHGKMKLPNAFKGKWFVLFSHPADFTPVCTTEFYAFQTRYEKFKELGAELIGLSVDQVFSHLKWMEWIKEKLGIEIEFPVIADDRGDLAEKLGMIPSGATITARAVFIVDPQATIRAIIYYPAEVGRDVDEILRALKALQISDKHGVALPHKWPENELVGSNVIIPPAGTKDAIKERQEAKERGEIECYDWWFCHKKVEG
ncbi:MAG: peroxiredoxin [Thermoplasmata archaeon]|nr:MAG: peroxiredoxin [Thermoplasmata archaeon]